MVKSRPHPHPQPHLPRRRALVDPIREVPGNDPATSTSGVDRYPFDEPPAALDDLPASRHEPIAPADPFDGLRGAGRQLADFVPRCARDMARPGLVGEEPEAAPGAEVAPGLYESDSLTSVARFRRGLIVRIAQSIEPSDGRAGTDSGGAAVEGPENGGARDRHGRRMWLGLDLDGTLLTQVGGRRPSGLGELGEVMPGAVEFVSTLAQLGWRISVFTARFAFAPTEDLRVHWAHEIAQYLAQKGVPVTDVWYGPKAPFHAILDDRAWRFTGDFRAVLAELTTLGQGEGT